MSDGARYRQRARDFEQRENWKRAIEAYELAIQADEKANREIDLALYNRVGDLYRRIGDVNRAVHYYERAADGHLGAGFYNNAIALCNKILRNQPNRHSAYLKLGKIGAAKGFLSDARKHFLEYAERMQRANQLDAAFLALIEFADLSPDPEVRLMIVDQLLEHGREEQAVEQLRLAWRDLNEDGREADAQEIRQRIIEMASDRDPEVDPPEASGSSGIDAEGVIDLPEILPYEETESTSKPAVAEEEAAEPTVLDELDADLEEDSEPEVEVELETDLELDEEEAADLDVEQVEIESFEGAEERESPAEPGEAIDIVPTRMVGDEADDGIGEDEGEEVEIVPTAIVSEEEGAEEAETEVMEEEAEEAETEVSEEEATPADRVAVLEARLQAEGQQPELLVELAEALLELGGREKATFYLGEALDLFEQRGEYRQAGRVLDELIRLNVNDVRAYQKRVELAFKLGDRSELIDAYLGLADCLDRTEAGNKARAVYARVLELDPQNRRALAALEMFGEEEETAAPAAGGRAAQGAGEFVDLGELVSEERKGAKSTRFRVPAADPQSEADVNFAEMLNQFKSKVAEAIEEEDASSHYDLGLAYKDMGLIDEAIAEFQIAARGTEYRLRAIEMLGACFLEKGEQRIAIKVLGRALQVPEYRDEDLIGIFYAMGRAYEDLNDVAHALEWYERVMGCDVGFKDVTQRVRALRQ